MDGELFEIEKDGRIDKRLAEVAPYSRSKIQNWIEAGKVKIKSEPIQKNDTDVTRGTNVQLDLGDGEITDTTTAKPQEGPLEVIYEDEQILAINKPSGLIVHPAKSHDEPTLVNHLLFHYPELKNVGNEKRPGLVHRLDKGTSGVILVARDQVALKKLKDQFRKRTVDKRYRAIVKGRVEDTKIKVEAPLGRSNTNPTLRKVDPRGKYASTKIVCRNAADEMSALECFPKTGRTHQIRVHCKYIGHPIVGDQKYNSESTDRLMLHAEEVTFIHPATDEEIKLSVSPPEEVETLWNQINSS